MTVAVSIIIPCFNQAAYVAKAVDSALAQTCPDYEIILVNDGSTDDTGQVFASLKAAHPDRIATVSQSNQGLSMARQSGLDRAAGEFIVFLDSDDQLLPGMLSACLAGFSRHPRAGAIVGRTMVAYENHPARSKILPPGNNARWPEILAVNPFGSPCSMMLKKQAIIEAGGAGLPGVRACEDWDLYARMIRRGILFEPIPDVLAIYLQHANVLSRDIELMLGEKIKMLERFSNTADPVLGAYRNGYVMFALGQAVGRQEDPSVLSGIAARLAPGQMQFRFYCNQFLYGLQHSISLTGAELNPAYIDQACLLISDRFTPQNKRFANMFTREIRREMRNPMKQRSVARRISRLLDPVRNLWVKIQSA